MVFFCGENVMGRVVKAGKKTVLIVVLKTCHAIELYFARPCGKRTVSHPSGVDQTKLLPFLFGCNRIFSVPLPSLPTLGRGQNHISRINEKPCG
jgi:hypothetical protein